MDIPNCKRCGVDLEYSVHNWFWYAELDDLRFPSMKGRKYCMKCYLSKFDFISAEFYGRSWPASPELERHLVKSNKE